MRLEFIGTALTCDASELVPPLGPSVQPEYVRALARAHEAAGFDRVLVGETSSSASAATVAGQILGATDALGAVVTVRPGRTAPTVAARELASLDAFFPGRVGVHLPAVANDAEHWRDGDWLTRPERQARREEFAGLLRRTWTSARPFDHAGEHYRIQGAWSSVRPRDRLPLYLSGASAASDALAAGHADVYLLPAEAPDAVSRRIARVTGAAGHRPRFGLRLRPIVGDTSTSARAFAERITRVLPDGDLSARVALRSATGALDDPDGLIGTAEQVAATVRRYAGFGISVFHLASFDLLADVSRFGELINLVR